jgi:hypothetical protein
MATLLAFRGSLSSGDVLQDDDGPATCPKCHHADAGITIAAVRNGEGWRCVRCTQFRDGPRLAAVAAYATWRNAHNR